MAKYIVVHGIRIATEFVPETFGRLTTLGPKFKLGNEQKQVYSCNCGNTVVARPSAVLTGNTKSCGCLNSQRLLERNTKHGMSDCPTFKIWLGMLSRCSNPKVKCYHNYGGRGIRVYEDWKLPEGRGFVNFIEHVGHRPSVLHTLERKDNDKNYEPGNVYWVSRKEQARNRRTNYAITFNGETLKLVEWAERTGIAAGLISVRIKKLNWTVEKALTTPVKKRKTSH